MGCPSSPPASQRDDCADRDHVAVRLRVGLGGEALVVSPRCLVRPVISGGRVSLSAGVQSLAHERPGPYKCAVEEGNGKSERYGSCKPTNGDGILLNHPARLIKKPNDALSHHGEAAHNAE